MQVPSAENVSGEEFSSLQSIAFSSTATCAAFVDCKKETKSAFSIPGINTRALVPGVESSKPNNELSSWARNKRLDEVWLHCTCCQVDGFDDSS